jgi:hypothetical protein
MVQSPVTTARAGSQRGQTVTAAKPARLARPERTPQWTGEHAGELTPAVDRGRHGISALEQAWWDGTEHTRRRRLSHALHRAERVQRLCRREPEEVDVRTPSPRSVGCRRHGKCDGASAPDIRHVPRHRPPRISSSSLVHATHAGALGLSAPRGRDDGLGATRGAISASAFAALVRPSVFTSLSICPRYAAYSGALRTV